jgi:hypothetical protein
MPKDAFFPSGFISLREAITRIAEVRGEPITQTEWERLDLHWSAVRTERERGTQGVHKDVLALVLDKTIEPLKSWYRNAANQFRLLADSDPSLTEYIRGDGLRLPMAPFWATPRAGRMLEEGVDSLEEESSEAQRRVLVREESLRRLLAAKHDQEIHPRERNTLLTIIAAMAFDGYGWNPRQAKSPMAKDISAAVQAIGSSISDDTVRKYLREAAEIIPPELLAHRFET